VTFAELDIIAYALSDNEFAETMQIAKSKLNQIINQSLRFKGLV